MDDETRCYFFSYDPLVWLKWYGGTIKLQSREQGASQRHVGNKIEEIMELPQCLQLA